MRVMLVAMMATACTASLVGSVIEHEVISGNATSRNDALKVMEANMNKMTPLIEQAARDGSDIVVLPEMALTALVESRQVMSYYIAVLPETGNETVACNNSVYATIPMLQRLSCAARENKIHLAVNWGEIVPCTNTDPHCPPDGKYQFNTELIFTDKGVLVAKYHKLHTFDATEFDTPPEEEFVYFVMKGVRVGIVTCFDAIYGSPLLPLIKKHNVSVFVLSHWWVNQYAMFSAAAWWQALSRRLDVSLLAAANWQTVDIPHLWNSGSGLYSRGNIIASWYNVNREHQEKLLTGTVDTNGGSGNNLPEYTNPIPITPPGPMCVQHFDWDAASIRVGEQYTGKVSCGPFSCEASFVVSQLPQQPEYWVLYMDRGYYVDSDGAGVYYYEEFCSLYKCNTADGCYGSKEQMHDDTGSTFFSSVVLRATFMPGSVNYATSSDGTGNVHPDIMTGLRFDDNPGKLSTANFTNLSHPLINLALVGRQYSLDGKVQ
eukprot:TRINITY_DN2470_c0_g1_i1.p1 TRINITY_DN2470_c0_g1~~TRINITY_DN2470_c0_g1_i1.p1  ORF type:complete len:489 (+),score=87.05 TRINITY_DN2470_c0_g1_i1:42-1508(+)